jgi:hypothetical protein
VAGGVRTSCRPVGRGLGWWRPGAATTPFPLAGGTAGPFWDGTAATRLTPYVYQVESADHGLFVPGPVTGSVDVLKGLVVAMTDFLDAIGRPG